MDSSLNSQRVWEELSLLISLYGRSTRLVIGGYTLIEVRKRSNREQKICLYKWT